ncbi:MAG: hypothetical protein ACKOWD_09815 [Rhodoferax sp.]
METIIVYVNDAEHARQTLAPMKRQALAPDANASSIQWILVACAPRLTRHVSKWLTHSARKQWRKVWSEKAFNEIGPFLKAGGDKVQTLTAQGSLTEMTNKLLREHGPARVLDARLARIGQDLMPVTQEQQVNPENRWVLPSALVGMGAIVALAGD